MNNREYIRCDIKKYKLYTKVWFWIIMAFPIGFTIGFLIDVVDMLNFILKGMR